MIDALQDINRKADLTIGFFKFLFVTTCILLLVVSLNEGIVHGKTTNDFDLWLWICNAVMVVMYLAAGGFFMFWFYPLYKQLYLDSPRSLRYAPVWTVLGFTFPIANLFLPYRLVANTWLRLREIKTAGTEGSTLSATKVPLYFKVWWVCHLICFFAVPPAYMAVLTRMQNPEGQVMQFALSVFAYLVVCVSALFAIRLVRELKSFS